MFVLLAPLPLLPMPPEAIVTRFHLESGAQLLPTAMFALGPQRPGHTP